MNFKKIDIDKYEKDEFIQELLRLIKANPELPVVPIVDIFITDEKKDNYGCYIGYWGSTSVDEYIIINGYIAVKSNDDVFYVLERYLSKEEWEALPDGESECRPLYEKLPWTKAIIVYITVF